ncbi:MAG: DUF934 domain-containing protein, partial [Pseudomonadota bacterium]
MALIKDGAYVDDPYTFIGDEEGDVLPTEGAVIVSLERWKNEGDALRARGTGLGLLLKSSDVVDDIVGDLEAFDLIAVEFPMFKDGRGFSTGRILRRSGFTGELRAVGTVLRDQLAFLHRVGFNSVDADDRVTPT